MHNAPLKRALPNRNTKGVDRPRSKILSVNSEAGCTTPPSQFSATKTPTGRLKKKAVPTASASSLGHLGTQFPPFQKKSCGALRAARPLRCTTYGDPSHLRNYLLNQFQTGLKGQLQPSQPATVNCTKWAQMTVQQNPEALVKSDQSVPFRLRTDHTNVVRKASHQSFRQAGQLPAGTNASQLTFAGCLP